jgi:hypothetical protein
MAPAYSKMTKREKQSNNFTVFPCSLSINQINQFNAMDFRKFTIIELKHILKQLNMRVSGNKGDLIARIGENLHNQTQCIKIQKCWRGFIVRLWIKQKSCGFRFKPIKAVNDSDFYTLEPLCEMAYSYKIYLQQTNNTDIIYGFHVDSLKSLIKQAKLNQLANPYTRENISNQASLLISIIKKHKIIHKLPDDPPEEKPKSISEQIRTSPLPDLVPALPRDSNINYNAKFRELFAKIDTYGFYTNASWVTELTQHMCYEFLAFLLNIWNRISETLKIKICPRISAFSVLNIGIQAFDSRLPRDDLIAILVRVGETMVYDGASIDERYLGASYYLTGLVMVSNQAKEALPWLHDNYHVIGRYP